MSVRQGGVTVTVCFFVSWGSPPFHFYLNRRTRIQRGSADQVFSIPDPPARVQQLAFHATWLCDAAVTLAPARGRPIWAQKKLSYVRWGGVLGAPPPKRPLSGPRLADRRKP
jgi:hypothetical protein